MGYLLSIVKIKRERERERERERKREREKERERARERAREEILFTVFLFKGQTFHLFYFYSI